MKLTFPWAPLFAKCFKNMLMSTFTSNSTFMLTFSISIMMPLEDSKTKKQLGEKLQRKMGRVKKILKVIFISGTLPISPLKGFQACIFNCLKINSKNRNGQQKEEGFQSRRALTTASAGQAKEKQGREWSTGERSHWCRSITAREQ